MDRNCERVEVRKDELFGLFSNLIKIDSYSFGPEGNEKQIAFLIGENCGKRVMNGISIPRWISPV